MEIATIGFTRTSAQSFFERLKGSGIGRVGDVRLHNTSQLAGFAKRDDLAYFLERLCGMECIELAPLATTADLLTAYRGKSMAWDEYERAYLGLLRDREVESTLDRADFEPGIVLLCSEDRPEHCHRRLAAEYLQSHWPDVSVRHL